MRVSGEKAISVWADWGMMGGGESEALGGGDSTPVKNGTGGAGIFILESHQLNKRPTGKQIPGLVDACQKGLTARHTLK